MRSRISLIRNICKLNRYNNKVLLRPSSAFFLEHLLHMDFRGSCQPEKGARRQLLPPSQSLKTILFLAFPGLSLSFFSFCGLEKPPMNRCLLPFWVRCAQGLDVSFPVSGQVWAHGASPGSCPGLPGKLHLCSHPARTAKLSRMEYTVHPHTWPQHAMPLARSHTGLLPASAPSYWMHVSNFMQSMSKEKVGESRTQ